MSENYLLNKDINFDILIDVIINCFVTLFQIILNTADILLSNNNQSSFRKLFIYFIRKLGIIF